MSDEGRMLVVAGYQDGDLAKRDFDDLVGLVRDKQVRAEGVILVGKDDDGQLTVADTGDHLGARAPAGAAVSASWSACSLRRCSPR